MGFVWEITNLQVAGDWVCGYLVGLVSMKLANMRLATK